MRSFFCWILIGGEVVVLPCVYKLSPVHSVIQTHLSDSVAQKVSVSTFFELDPVHTVITRNEKLPKQKAPDSQ